MHLLFHLEDMSCIFIQAMKEATIWFPDFLGICSLVPLAYYK